MLMSLKPTDAEIESLALAETDPRQQARFAPLRWGFIGNLTVMIFAGIFGLIHALLARLWRGIFSTPRNAGH